MDKHINSASRLQQGTFAAKQQRATSKHLVKQTKKVPTKGKEKKKESDLTLKTSLATEKKKELSFTEKWNLKDNNGKKVPKGQYTVNVKMLIDIPSATNAVSGLDSKHGR